MAEIIGLGLSHYPGPLVPAECWPRMLKTNVEKGRIPADLYEDRARWPQAMVKEWGNDEGLSAALTHHDRLIAGHREMRRRLDAFDPDIVLVWGDDQYENFRKDGVPAFCVYIFDEIVCRPFANGMKGPFRTERNAWDLPTDSTITVRGHREGAAALMRDLLAQDFDPAYAFEARDEKGLSHAFAYTALFLDYDRRGFDYPVIPLHVNCYGSQMMKTAAREPMVSPPSPSPRRCFALGAAVARFFKASPWRVALIGSSSWSHGSLTAKHQRLYPDIEADRKRFEELKSGAFRDWHRIGLDEIEDSGQNEFLNWVCLAGAMSELGYRADIVDYVESYAFNSSKCFAVFGPQ